MQHSWNHKSQPLYLDVEHRLTVVETEQKHHKKTTAQHGRRITAIEAKLPQKQPWQPRDYLLTGAGAIIALAAIFEKIGWATAISGIIRLYGVK